MKFHTQRLYKETKTLTISIVISKKQTLAQNQLISRHKKSSRHQPIRHIHNNIMLLFTQHHEPNLKFNIRISKNKIVLNQPPQISPPLSIKIINHEFT